MKWLRAAVIFAALTALVWVYADESAPFSTTQTKPAIPGTSETPTKIILTPDTPFSCVPNYDAPAQSLFSFDVQARKADETIVLFGGIYNTSNFVATVAQLIATGKANAGTFRELREAMCFYADAQMP